MEDVEVSRSTRTFAVYPIEKIRPTDDVRAPAEATMRLARNEREPILAGIVNQSDRTLHVTGIEVSVSTQADFCPYLIEAYETAYFTAEKPTRPVFGRGRIGRWPDPLVPLTPRQPSRTRISEESSTRIYTYRLNRPQAVPPDENRMILVDVYLPPARTPAQATRVPATMTVSFVVNGVPLTEPTSRIPPSVQVAIEPFDFELPRAQTFETAVGFTWGKVVGVHRHAGLQPEDEAALHHDYIRVLARNKLAPYRPQREPVPVTKDEDGNLTADWTSFDRTAGEVLDGTLFEDAGPASTIRFPPSASGLETESDRQEFEMLAAEHFRDRGWLDRAYAYLFDEPMLRELSHVRARGLALKRRIPDLATMVTQPFTPLLAAAIDIWVPQVTDLGDTLPFFPIFFEDRRVVLDWQTNYSPWVYRVRGRSERAWYYTAMGAQYWTFPDLFIDSDLADHRVIPWLAFRYNLSGYLHWSTTASYGGEATPWTKQRIWYTNGDGTLLYPALPSSHNVSRHRAAPSLRMIALREGIDDYEYLSLLEDLAGRYFADRMAQEIVRNSVSFENSEKLYNTMRRRTASRIERRLQPSQP
jgi:hypothetical protein